MPPSREVTITLDGLAHGGDAVGRLDDGKACFVAYAIPGETVRARILEERKRFARAMTVEVLEASPDRVAPPCPHFGPQRCGGCRLQHIAPARQAALLRQVVVDALERIGGLVDPPVAETLRPHGGDGLGYRTQARFAPDEQGRLGLRRGGSHVIEPIAHCPLLDAGASAARTAAGDTWPGVAEVVVRGDADGRASLEIHPGPGPLPPLPPGETPVAVVGTDGAVALRGEPTLREHAAGRSWQVSATSFFQPSRAGAEALATLVAEAADLREDETALDLFCGVGLLAGTLGTSGAAVTAVEADPAAAEDAAVNLADLDAEVLCGDAGEVVADLVEAGVQADVVVLDPPRRGAGAELATALATVARWRIVYVACDPAALARDARALAEAGWELVRAVPVDEFTHTAHVEVVATFEPSSRP